VVAATPRCHLPFKSSINSEETGQILPLRRIAQERVPTAPNVGSRDVTWVIDGLPELLQ